MGEEEGGGGIICIIYTYGEMRHSQLHGVEMLLNSFTANNTKGGMGCWFDWKLEAFQVYKEIKK